MPLLNKNNPSSPQSIKKKKKMGLGGTLFLAIASTYCILLLLDCKKKLQTEESQKQQLERDSEPTVITTPAKTSDLIPAVSSRNWTFADIGRAAFGGLGNFLVDLILGFSQVLFLKLLPFRFIFFLLTVSKQTGICIAYLIFISSNLMLIAPIPHIPPMLGTGVYVAAALLILAPISCKTL